MNILKYFCIFFIVSISIKSETIWVGLTPWQKGQSEDEINHLYLPMMNYLKEKTGNDFKIRPMASYEETIDLLVSGKIQMAVLSPAPYVKAKKENPKIEILATELSWNQDKTKKTDSYRSFILVNKKRDDIKSIQDLKDKTFGMVSEESTSGYKVPMAFLRSQKIDHKTYFKKLLLLGSHPSVTDAIAAGSIDGGATWDYNWSQAVIKNGDVYKSLWSSDPIPNICIAAHQKLDANTKDKIKKALLVIPEDSLKGLSSVGYVYRPDSFYDSVRKINKLLNN